MPEKMERKLKAKAKKMGLGKERTGAYVYGTMRETGWKPSTQKHHSPPIHEKFDPSKY